MMSPTSLVTAARVSGETVGGVWACRQVGMRTAVRRVRARRMAERYHRGWVLRLGIGEAEGIGVQVEGEADGFDDGVVFFGLREAGDGGGADDARAGDMDGEAAAMRGVVGVGETITLGEMTALLFEEV